MVSQFFSSELLEKLGGFVTFIDKLAIIIIVLLVTLIVKSAANRIVNHMFDKKKGRKVISRKNRRRTQRNTEKQDQKSDQIYSVFIAIMIIWACYRYFLDSDGCGRRRHCRQSRG
jgi:1,4-dihydroxy-2-naphthoate octaprenyltransferase